MNEKIVKIFKNLYNQKRKIVKMTIFSFAVITIIYGVSLSLGALYNLSQAQFYLDTFFKNALYISFYLQYIIVFLIYVIKFRKSTIIPMYLLLCLYWIF